MQKIGENFCHNLVAFAFPLVFTVSLRLPGIITIASYGGDDDDIDPSVSSCTASSCH